MRSMLPLAGNITKLPRFSASSSRCGVTEELRGKRVKDGKNQKVHQTSLCSFALDDSVSNLLPLSCEPVCVCMCTREGALSLSSDWEVLKGANDTEASYSTPTSSSYPILRNQFLEQSQERTDK